MAARVEPVVSRYACWPGSDGWLLLDNAGSYQGWFDWLPLKLRTGPWHWSAFAFIVGFYVSLFMLRPPLEFPVTAVAAFSPWWYADVCVAIYSVVVMVVSWSRYGGPWPYLMSYTGWSWCLLTARAACTSAGSLHGALGVGARLAHLGSALRFPAICGAVITFTLWNAVLLPLVLYNLPSDGDESKPLTNRKGFLRFNFSFFMTNVHVANLPLAALNVAYGEGARPFGWADLWAAYAVMSGYAIVYVFVLDRYGMHFYPMFSPRTPLCVLSYSLLISMYYLLWKTMAAV